jgi:hypothetical protein
MPTASGNVRFQGQTGHKADIRRDVRFRGQSGKHVLDLSLTAFDPKPT